MIYFFHLHECGAVLLDEEGCELPSLDAAHEFAWRAARDVMCGEIQHGQLCLSCCIVIENAHHQEVSKVWFRDAVTVTGLTASC